MDLNLKLNLSENPFYLNITTRTLFSINLYIFVYTVSFMLFYVSKFSIDASKFAVY